MKRLLGVLILVISMFCVVPAYADTNNFYFSDFTGDYYLTKNMEGESRLKVKEEITAVFPNYNQNKGICRQIPYTNQDGANITLPNLSRLNIAVQRDGAYEPIYSIQQYNGHYEVCTGDDDYVLGEQVYTFEYEFKKVVTDFGDYQELYWDTNGNGWGQRFDYLTARVHFDETVKDTYAGKQWCYVGAYGASGQNRCTINEIDDGVEFTTEKLRAGENLTFDIELKAGSFIVPEPVYNYTLIWVMIGAGVAGALLLACFPGRKYLQARAKIREYKGMFTAPQYQPDNHSLVEMAEVYLGKKKNAKVGVLLDMIVKKKVELRKVDDEEKTHKWEIIVGRVADLELTEKYLLKILNGGAEIGDDYTIEVKGHVMNGELARMNKKFSDEVLEALKKDELVDDKYKIGDSGASASIWNVLVGFVVAVPFVLMGWVMIAGTASIVTAAVYSIDGKLVGEEMFVPVVSVIIVAVVAIWLVLARRTRKYAHHTMEGLKASKYMEGLRLYISMAEAERLKFLQSVKGADVSATGIVKLYEKLLPYAAVFGLEESWMDEMKQYCEVQEIEAPDYLTSGIAAYELSRMMRDTVGYSDSSSYYSGGSISGGGGWSSGFSGGGGGGFSGGGGGGGGGGGR